MARELIFKIRDKEYTASTTKIDRKKLYGWTETLALDDEGNECKLVSMDSSGTVVIPKGGIALGILSPDGTWVNRAELKAIDKNGNEAKLIPSSYEIITELNNKVSINEFLDHSVKAFYELGASKELTDIIGGNIYSFIYSYGAGYTSEKAFVLTSGEEQERKLFMVIGTLNNFEMMTFNQSAVIDEVEEEEEESDEIDFSMF